ncbi:MAG: hypothetical protein ACI97A_001944 [Planctomycetota bacterium]|jgi:hypothetical protein
MSHLRYGAFLVLGLLALSACNTSVEYTREPRIVYPEDRDRYEDVSIHKIFHDGKMVGYADSKRLKDGDSNDLNDRHQIFILDSNRDAVGFVTDHNAAYRYQAHGPSKMVGVNTDLASNAMAIFGWNHGAITLEKMVYVEK